ncbi:MAG: hypothetical protein E6J34_15385 [Chloroflexi bacterium]|nr:MAG: hypothetical protein E6J34_15385 [Chloroflexota bacterium]
MSNHYTTGSGSGASSNNNAFGGRRTGSLTGALPALGPEKPYSGAFDFDQMIQALRELFEHDRQIASQPDSTRCGICYLYFPLNELCYREDGFYICSACERSLGKQSISMLRQQQKF